MALGRNFGKRFWPLPLAVLLTALLTLGLSMIAAANQRGWALEARMHEVGNSVYHSVFWMLFCVAGASFLAAALVFHHLHSQKEIQFYHGLPLRRLKLYGTAYLSGLLMIALPMALGIVLCMPLALALGAGQAVEALLTLLLAGLASLLLFYGLAALACILAGQTFGALLIYVGMNCAVAVLLGGAGAIASLFMPGIDFGSAFEPVVMWLTPLAKLISALAPRYETVDALGNGYDARFEMAVGFTEILAVIVYAAAGLVLCLLSGWLYQIRRSEMAGEMVAFGPVRTLSKLFGSAMVCVAGSVLVLNTAMFPEGAPFWAVVLVALAFGFLGWMAAEMVVRKSLRVFGTGCLRSCGVFLLALLVCLGLGKADPLGRVAYVPDPSNVELAELQLQYGIPVTVTGQEAASIHQTILDHRELLADYTHRGLFTASAEISGDRPTVSVCYKLKNGHIIRRNYRIARDWDQEQGDYLPNPVLDPLETLLRKPEYCYQTWFGSLPEEGLTRENIALGTLDIYPEAGEDGPGDLPAAMREEESFQNLEPEEALSLFTEIRRDIDAGNVPPQGFEQNGLSRVGYVWFEYYTVPYDPAKYPSRMEFAEQTITYSVGMELTPEMTYTMSWVRDHFD